MCLSGAVTGPVPASSSLQAPAELNQLILKGSVPAATRIAYGAAVTAEDSSTAPFCQL